jgi:hypothetical protein
MFMSRLALHANAPRMTVALLAAALLALAIAGIAGADHLDPQEQIRSADQRRAVAMLVRASDLEPGYERERTSNLEPHLTCRGLDESDLVLTGNARSPYWSREYRIVGSSATVYRTEADSKAAWRRSTSSAARGCIGAAFRAEFARQGEAVRVSVSALDLPVLAAGVPAHAYRVAISEASPAQHPAALLDFVLLRRGRAQATVLFATIVVPPDRESEISLSRVVAKRMRAVMRGVS